MVKSIDPVTEMSDCFDGDLKLEGGEREGRVDVCFSRAWGSICPNFFSSEDAAVICHQLNQSHQNFGPGIMCTLSFQCTVVS